MQYITRRTRLLAYESRPILGKQFTAMYMFYFTDLGQAITPSSNYSRRQWSVYVGLIHFSYTNKKCWLYTNNRPTYSKTVVTCKIKHFILQPSTSRSYAMDVKML